MIVMGVKMKVQKATSQFTITLPKSIADAMSIGKGSEVIWSIAGQDTLKLEVVR